MGIGGTEQVIFQLVNHADKSLFENSIVCLEGEIGPIGQQLQESGTSFHILNREPGFDINLIKSVRKIISSENIDVVHCHQYTPYVTVFWHHCSPNPRLFSPSMVAFTRIDTAGKDG